MLVLNSCLERQTNGSKSIRYASEEGKSPVRLRGAGTQPVLQGESHLSSVAEAKEKNRAGEGLGFLRRTEQLNQ